MYKVHVKPYLNEKAEIREFETKINPNSAILNNRQTKLDIVRIRENYFHIIWDGYGYRAELLNSDMQKKTFLVKINGEVFELKVEDQFDQLLNKMGLNQVVDKKINDIVAPMPGMILEIMVNAGDQVKKGDQLLILNAMKMENVIKSPGEGTVAKILITKGETVEKNQILIQF
ncbi:MAG: biotin/lipoyl-containing protein [Candidatus Cyclobacteriaceae bacterium M3_2C_046]